MYVYIVEKRNIMRTPPAICPVCEKKIVIYESGRVLCSDETCEFEWHWFPLVKILKVADLPEKSVRLLQNQNLTNTEFLCYLNGQQGGTIHQIAKTLCLTVDQILKAKDIRGLLNSVAETK